MIAVGNGRHVDLRSPRQREVHGDRHDHRHRHAVEQRRRELPLTHGVECRLIEQRQPIAGSAR